MADVPTTTPARDGLVAAVAELSRVSASTEQLQHALGPLLLRGGEASLAAQALDDITQHLRGLEGFLGTIARYCPPEWRIDLAAAADPLGLHAQKLRLTGGDTATTTIDTPSPQPPTGGELELW